MSWQIFVLILVGIVATTVVALAIVAAWQDINEKKIKNESNRS